MKTWRRVALLCAGAGVLGAVTAPASGSTAMQSGWWTVSPVAIAPDAPKGGLVVQGGSTAEQPFAYAAVSYVVDSGSSPSSLKLLTAPDSASTPNAGLSACPLTASFTPAEGGPSSSGPPYDCGTKVAGTVSSDGSTYSFDVSRVAGNGTLAVAIVPNAATDRVVLSQPDASSLTVIPASSPATNVASPDRPATAAPSNNAAAPRPVTPATSTDVAAAPAPAPAASVATPSIPATANRDSGGGPGRGVVFAAVALLAAALWRLAGGSTPAALLGATNKAGT